jgi:hypothetical protein
MSDGTFYGYILLLVISGIALSVLAARGFGQSTGARVLDGLFSVGFLGYAFYLSFVFDGGQVRILFYAFIVPIVASVKAFKGWKAQQEAVQSRSLRTPRRFSPGRSASRPPVRRTAGTPRVRRSAFRHLPRPSWRLRFRTEGCPTVGISGASEPTDPRRSAVRRCAITYVGRPAPTCAVSA